MDKDYKFDPEEGWLESCLHCAGCVKDEYRALNYCDKRTQLCEWCFDDAKKSGELYYIMNKHMETTNV